MRVFFYFFIRLFIYFIKNGTTRTHRDFLYLILKSIGMYLDEKVPDKRVPSICFIILIK